MTNSNSKQKEEKNPLQKAAYAFIIAVSEDGQTFIQAFPDKEGIAPPRSLGDVAAACDAASRDITIQQTAVAVQQAMLQAARQMQQTGGMNATDGGIVVPDHIEVKK